MKLCRFLLAAEPAARTGIFHNGAVYETDGQRALGVHKPEDVTLLAPVGHAPTLRAFCAFQPPLLNGIPDIERAAAKRLWEAAPSFSFSDSASLIGPEATVPKPACTEQLDYELQVAAVIGRAGSDVPADEADDHILGFTIVNAWTARDIQRREAAVGLGAGKARDFATSIGPFLVTPEELEDKIVDREHGNRYSLNMKALVNGEVYSSSNLHEMRWTFAQLIAEASRGTHVAEGDLITSGCAVGGCILELGKEYLKPGDEVTLVVERLGTLANRVAERQT